MCVTRANESFNDITKKNKMKALENKYIHIKYMYKVIQFVKSNAFFFFFFFFFFLYVSDYTIKTHAKSLQKWAGFSLYFMLYFY